MKKFIASLLAILLFAGAGISVFADNAVNNAAEIPKTTSTNLNLNVKSALLMEANSGKILYSENEEYVGSPASVTKIMTLLLVMEALESEKINPTDSVTISQNAASMGGSQVFLEEGEKMSVEELLKCTVIASANDAALALAEHVAGSEDAFVSLMNQRAAELEMKNTNFENVTGLDDTVTNHYTSAKDIAIMSRMLIKYDLIRKYSSKWQDTIRNGTFTLTNTNRLVRFYDGCNGLKTGSTDKAGFCISATAERDGMQLIAVIMGAETRDTRNAAAKSLLDFGFTNYALFCSEKRMIEEAIIYKGKVEHVPIYTESFFAVVPKGSVKKVDMVIDVPTTFSAPIKENETVGYIIYKLDDVEIGRSRVFFEENIEEISFFDIFSRLLAGIFSC